MSGMRIQFKQRSFTRQANFFSVIILLLLLVIILSACGTQDATSDPALTAMSQSAFEEQYGIRVQLVAVTAAGGLVDVRFQFVDGAKAQALLQEANNFPTLFIADRARTLSVDEETKKQAINFVDGGHLFLMYSNAGTVVKPGTPVTIVFGTIQLEPINAK